MCWNYISRSPPPLPCGANWFGNRCCGKKGGQILLRRLRNSSSSNENEEVVCVAACPPWSCYKERESTWGPLHGGPTACMRTNDCSFRPVHLATAVNSSSHRRDARYRSLARIRAAAAAATTTTTIPGSGISTRGLAPPRPTETRAE